MEVIFKENNIFYNVLCFLITENEKLFDRSDAKLYWKTVCHLGILYHHAFVGIFANNLGLDLKTKVDETLYGLYRFRLAYLTGWNFMFQTVFLFLALSHDGLEWASKQETALATKIRYWRDVIFSGLVVPYTCFVFSMFWSLYAIDRELVFPRVYDLVVPWWFNHCVHTNIMALLVLETVLQARRQPADRRLELIFNVTTGILYAIVYYSIYFLAGRWLYNVFGIFTWWQVCLFQLLIWISSYVFYELQFPINRLIHGKEPEEQKTIENKPQQNGETKNGDVRNGEITEVNEIKQNGEAEKSKTNGTNNINFKAPPFSTKSWSLKYRNIRSQFENSSL